MLSTAARSQTATLIMVIATFVSPAYGSRLPYENVGNVTAPPTGGAIQINGATYRLGTNVTIHGADKTTGNASIRSLKPGTTIGYSTVNAGGGKKHEITSIWMLPTK